jgi:hypothetical protein
MLPIYYGQHISSNRLCYSYAVNSIDRTLITLLHQGPFKNVLAGREFAVGLMTPERKWVLFSRQGFLGVQPVSAFSLLDGQLECSEESLEAMLKRQVPIEPVKLLLGGRSGNPRLSQAFGLCVAALLGWAGPWPDAEVDLEHHRLLRRAVLDLLVGIEDARYRLFEGLPVEVRLREEAGGACLCTEGLSDKEGWPELLIRSLGAKEGILRLQRAVRRLQEAPESVPLLQCTPLPLARHWSTLAELSNE